ncbi:MAG: MarR family transcriptional regulator [Chloroflexota bacterium]|nr:MarR family transcriptional regulator [Chloroflexota bacterium]
MSRLNETIADAVLEELAPLLSRAKAAWAAHCQEHGVSMLHMQVLAHLERAGPASMSSLADHLGVSLPNASGIVSRMEERGLIERSHDTGDRRRVMVRLTDAGAAFTHELGDLRRAHVTALIAALPPASQRNLLRALRDVRTAIARRSEEPTTA